MKYLNKVIILIAITFYAGIALSNEISSDSAYKLMELTGLNKQISNVPDIQIAAFEQAQKQQDSILTETELTEIKRILRKSFDPVATLAAIKHNIQTNITAAEAKSLLAWYESDLGREITKAEEDATTAEAYPKMMEEAKTLLSNKELVALSLKIDKLMGSTENAYLTYKNTILTTSTALLTVKDPSTSKEKIELLKKSLDGQKTQIKANVHQIVILSFAYYYKNISKSKVSKYISFLERPFTKRLIFTVNESMQQSTNKSIEKFATGLVDEFKKNEKI